MTLPQSLKVRDALLRQHRKAGWSEDKIKSWLKGWKVAGKK